MDADEEPIRLNSSSYCNECKTRTRVYKSNKRGSVIAFCPMCDADANNPIGYKKKTTS